MTTFDDALADLLALAQPLGVEATAVAGALDRTLAEDAVARLDAPRDDLSAMDGYAVRDADLAVLPARLPVALRGFPGDLAPPLPPGSCARVFTGSALPSGATRVVMQEDVARDGDVATFARPPGARPHVRPRGLDFREGDVLAPRGTRLGARALVALAGGDLATVAVHRRPRIALITTGDELVPAGTARSRPGGVPDSVSLGLTAWFRIWGGDVVDIRRIGDDLPKMVAHAGAALAMADVIVVTGGASVGERDFAKAMFEPHGLSLVFNKVAMKPGKPVWLGRVGERLVLGLPGNPVSAMVTARLFAAPLIAGLGGRPTQHDWRPLPLVAAIEANGDREHFALARAVDGGVALLAEQDSSMQRALIHADLLVRRAPRAPALAAGMPVDTLVF